MNISENMVTTEVLFSALVSCIAPHCVITCEETAHGSSMKCEAF